ncbi:hypothetical protein BaRGS_00020385 [Batillaria attramentaria]|uniref:Amidase domain-containing protein n=1 Tax=Batillaria attramentaria TaxID=370345 RepID=A0ABD0KME0_9CAEN
MLKAMAEKRSYHAPALSGPQVDDFRRLNQEMKFRCTEEELQGMAKIMEGVTAAYQRVSELPDTSLPVVRYPRTPGYRPGPDDNPYNAWAWRCDIPGAAEGKLSGRTVGIKDNTAVAGVPMRNGGKLLENYVPEFDATVVSRILDAGGRIVGKTSVEDTCFSGSSITNTDGPVRNPRDETRIAGGSSGGSAAVVAAGLVDMAIGGDQGGSIRIPSSFNGIVGLKPTFGLVPYTGASAIEPTVDHLGPMTTTVADCALLLEVIAGYDDGRDPRQFPNMAVPEYSRLIDGNVSGKKVGLLKEGFDNCTEDIVKTIVRGVANNLPSYGISVADTSIPMHRDGGAIWTVGSGQGLYHCMLRDGGATYYTKGFYPASMQEATFRGVSTHPHDIPPLVKFYSMYGEYMTQLYGHGNKFYAKANNLVMELTRQYDAALQKFDVIVMPTLPYVATKIPPADIGFADYHHHTLSMASNTMPFNSTGHPAITVNAGFAPTDDGKQLPVGLMIVGKKFDDVTVLQVARAVEKLAPKDKLSGV